MEVNIAPQSCSHQQPFLVPSQYDSKRQSVDSSTVPVTAISPTPCNDYEYNKSSDHKHVNHTVTSNCWDLDNVTFLIMVVGAADCLILFVVGLEIAVFFLPI
jgi:hypothetical protein